MGYTKPWHCRFQYGRKDQWGLWIGFLWVSWNQAHEKGLGEESSSKRFLKKETAFLLMIPGLEILTSPMWREDILFLLRLLEAYRWKILVFLSPSFSHCIREFWALKTSFFFSQSHSSHWAAAFSFNSVSDKSLSFDKRSHFWISCSKEEIISSM